jgi:hypothetical protein
MEKNQREGGFLASRWRMAQQLTLGQRQHATVPHTKQFYYVVPFIMFGFGTLICDGGYNTGWKMAYRAAEKKPGYVTPPPRSGSGSNEDPRQSSPGVGALFSTLSIGALAMVPNGPKMSEVNKGGMPKDFMGFMGRVWAPTVAWTAKLTLAAMVGGFSSAYFGSKAQQTKLAKRM